MSRSERLISAFLVLHLASITKAALPPLGHSAVSTLLDGISAAYVQTFSLNQDWRMFVNPALDAEYVRITFWVEAGAPVAGEHNAVRAVDLRALPEIAPGRVRNDFESFRASFRDRAVDRALDLFAAGYEDSRLVDPGNLRISLWALSGQPNPLSPVTRYFRRFFVTRSLAPNEHVVRTELWYGHVSGPLPEQQPKPAAVTPLSPREPGALEDEGGIHWTLYFVDKT
jgi:hypothetical protein